MNSPTVFTSKSGLFWVALTALAALAAPASAQTPYPNPSTVGFSYIRQGTQPTPVTVAITDGVTGPGLTVTNVTITQPTSPAPIAIFSYSIIGTSVIFGLDNSQLYYLANNVNGAYPAGVYTGSALVTVAGGATTTVALTITVNQTVNFSVIPSSLPTFQVAVGGLAYQTVTVSTTGGATNFTATTSTTSGGSWLLVNNTYSLTGTTSSGLSVSLTLTANGAGLAVGTYYGNVAITPSGGSVVNLPVTMVVGSGSSGLAANPSAVNLTAAAGSSGIQQQTLYIQSYSGAASFNAYFTNNTCNCVSVTPTSGSFFNSQGTLTVYANPTNLASGTYTANLYVYASDGSSANIPVNFTVGTGSGGSGLTASPSTVSLTAASGSSGTQQQTLYIQSYSGATTYNAYFTTNTCNCVSVSPTSGSFYNTQATMTVFANPTNVASGTYTANLYVYASNGSSANIPVNFTVGTGSSSGVTLSPNNLSFYAPYVNYAVTPQTVSILTASSGVTYTASSSTGWLQLTGTPTGTLTPGVSSYITVNVNTSGLAQGTYNGSIYVTTYGGLSTSQTISVVLNVGTGGSGATGASVAPTALNFVGQAGAASVPGDQYIGVGGSNVQYTVSSTMQTGSGWLTVEDRGNGSAPGFIRAGVSTTGLAAGTYTGTINVLANGTTTPVTVTLSLTAAPSVVVGGSIGSIGSIYYNFSSLGQVSPPSMQVSMSNNSTGVPATVSSSATWITPRLTSSTLPASLFLTLDNTGLPGGLNSGSVTVSANNQTVVVPVVVNNPLGTGGSGGTTGPLSISPSSVSMSAQSFSGVQSQTVNLYASVFSTYTAYANTSSGGSWLAVSPSSASISGGSSTTLYITANPSSLAAGTYSGTVTLTVNGINQTIPVTLTVGGGANTLNFSPTSLSFTYTAGAAAPAAQAVQVAGTSTQSITYTTSVNTSSGGSWLAVTPAAGGTTSSIQVSILPNVLTTAGTYNGTVSVTPQGGAAQTIPVTVTVTAPPTVSATPATLTFSYRSGDAVPASQNISVTGTNSTTALSFSATATTQSGGNWLSVSPAAGTTPASLNVNLTPGSLDPGTYTGTITVTGVNGASGTGTTTVTLTVTAPLPTITRVVSEASGASGALSPGEIIRIQGTAIGPSTAAYGALDSSTARWQTTVGGVQVLVNGLAAPVIAASATQVSAIVPYEAAGQLSAFVQVRFRGSTSNAITLPVTSTVPGIFTQNFTGTGPGAILNEDGSVNGPANPAAKSTATDAHYVVLYATGEGLSRNASGAAPATGQVINVVSINDLPRPLLPVAVQIDGQPCNVVYAGSVNGQIAGLFQINVQVPPNVNSGAVSVVVSVGSNTSPSGVTVSIR